MYSNTHSLTCGHCEHKTHVYCRGAKEQDSYSKGHQRQKSRATVPPVAKNQQQRPSDTGKGYELQNGVHFELFHKLGIFGNGGVIIISIETVAAAVCDRWI